MLNSRSKPNIALGSAKGMSASANEPETPMSPSPRQDDKDSPRKTGECDPDGPQSVNSNFTGSILNGRYYVGRLLDKGSFGQVFKIVDLQDKTRPLAMKVQPTTHIFEKEIHAMKSIWRRRDGVKL